MRPLKQREERATKSPPDPAVSTVALNFQTPGYEMDLNAGRFLVNGQCGYILKPACLRQPDTNFDPESPGPPRTTLTIQVSSLGQALPWAQSRLVRGHQPAMEEDGGGLGTEWWAGGQGQAEALHPSQVLTAQQLPKLNAEKPSSIVDPLVRVEIYGVPMDCARKETNYVLNNGGWACWWRRVGRQQSAGRCRAEASWLRPPSLFVP